jgi:hypothetical protein
MLIRQYFGGEARRLKLVDPFLNGSRVRAGERTLYRPRGDHLSHCFRQREILDRERKRGRGRGGKCEFWVGVL